MLQREVDRYNELCAAGEDVDFGKPAEYLKAIATPPFYAIHRKVLLAHTLGGIHTNRDMQVLREDGSVIEGLYAVGVDSAELYCETYTLNISGSCMGNNLNSGRTAAKHAVKNRL